MITKMALCVFQTLSEDVIHQCCGHSGEPAPETAKQDAEPGTTCQYLLSLIILSPFLVISVFFCGIINHAQIMHKSSHNHLPELHLPPPEEEPDVELCGTQILVYRDFLKH